MNSFPLKQFYPLASVNTSYKIILARLNYFFNLELKYIFEVNLRTGFNFYFSTLEYGMELKLSSLIGHFLRKNIKELYA